MMKIWVDIENSAGNKLGPGPITTAPGFDQTKRLDRAGEFACPAPATDSRAALIVKKRVLRCRGIVNGAVEDLGAGVIDKTSVSAGGAPVLQVNGGGLERELTYRSVGFLEISDGAGGGVSTALADIMAFAPAGWSIDVVNGYATTTNLVYANFAGESVLAALVKLAEHTGEHFRFDGRKLVWLRKAFTSSGVRAVQVVDPVAIESQANLAIITDLNEVEDSFDLLSRIYPFGSGTGEARLTLGPTTKSAPAGYTLDAANNYLKHDSAESTYGRIDRYLSFKDIRPISNTSPDLVSAANALFDAAYEYLSRYATPAKFYSLSVAKLDTEVLPGQTIHVVYRRVVDGFTAIDIDADLYVLETTTRVDTAGVRTVGMVVATVDRWPVSDDEMLAGEMDQGKVFEAFPQMNANAHVVSYSEPMDDAKGAQFDFWLGEEVVTVNQVLLRFKIEPLRSTVKSAASGGGSTQTSEGGAGTQETAQNDGGMTTSDGSHVHVTYVLGPVTPNISTIGWYQDGGLVTPVNSADDDYEFHAGVSPAHEHTIPDHTHTVTIANHTHDVTIPSHTHSMVYGLFEESGANTLAETDLVYKLNGGSDLGAGVISLGSGWYALDITAQACDANFRPVAQANQIVISTATAKTAQIKAQLLVRAVIQATAMT